MQNDKDPMIEKDDEKVTSTSKRIQENYASTGRPNIDNINRRNTEEAKQDRKSSYTIIGIALLLVAAAIIIVINFF